MTTIELKSNFHKLIDNFDNDNVLFKFYEILDRVKESEEGALWAKLSPEEKHELISIENESYYSENLIPHSQMKNKHSVWL